MENPIVELQECQVSGIVDRDINGIPFYSFLGIPYAEPPIGKLRFKPPVAKRPWHGIWQADTEPPVPYCLQQLPYSPHENPVKQYKVQGSEDCLYLNVFTRELLETGIGPLRPVMVFIPGGAFTSGSAARHLYGPNALMSEDIVLVTIQYRLGCFGFLVFNDENLGIPGNAGLKDIVQALRWVQENIRSFRGDPKNVTIFGEDAGGAAAHYLLLSPQTNGLFHKVIIQSGTSLATWARGRKPNGHLLARALGFRRQDERQILEFLRSLSTCEIYEGQQVLQDPASADVVRYFGPVIEHPSAQAFISAEPLEIIASSNYNKLPIMMGYAEKEGLVFIFIEKHYENAQVLVTQNFVPYDLRLARNAPEYEEMEATIRDFYNLNNIDPDNRTADEIINLSTDVYFLKDISLAALLHSKRQDESVYFYKITADTQLNYLKTIAGINCAGTCHSDDMGYLFTNIPATNNVDPESIEDITRRRFLKLWTKFARTGNPNPREKDLIPIEWKPIQENQFHYLEIGNELKAEVNPDNERMKFWLNIYKSNPIFGNHLEDLHL